MQESLIEHNWFNISETDSKISCTHSRKGKFTQLYSYPADTLLLIIHHISLLLCNWSKCIMWPYMPRVRLGNIQIYPSDILQFSKVTSTTISQINQDKKAFYGCYRRRFMFVCLQSLTREHWKVNISYSRWWAVFKRSFLCLAKILEE